MKFSTNDPGFDDPKRSKVWRNIINNGVYKVLKDYRHSKQFLVDSIKSEQNKVARTLTLKEVNRLSKELWKPEQLKKKSVARFRNQFKRFAKNHSYSHFRKLLWGARKMDWNHKIWL
tara:strand:+ start:381 stop:731 length:351 start_codon:yes stop_codon:yes gene_type:complete